MCKRYFNESVQLLFVRNVYIYALCVCVCVVVYVVTNGEQFQGAEVIPLDNL